MKNHLFWLLIGEFLCMARVAEAQPKMGFAADPADPNVRTEQINGLSDAKSKQVLGQLYKTYENQGIIKAKIVVSSQSSSPEIQTANVLVKGNKYRVETSSQTMVSNGQTTWLYLKSGNKVQISQHLPSEESYFSYPVNYLKVKQKDYVTKCGSDVGINITKVELEAFDNIAEYKKIIVEVNKATWQVVKMTLIARNDKTTTLSVENISLNIEVEGDIFVFDTSKVPAANIIDLR